jgi:hypothetical protein
MLNFSKRTVKKGLRNYKDKREGDKSGYRYPF